MKIILILDEPLPSPEELQNAHLQGITDEEIYDMYEANHKIDKEDFKGVKDKLKKLIKYYIKNNYIMSEDDTIDVDDDTGATHNFIVYARSFQDKAIRYIISYI